MEKVWLYERLFFEVVIVMVKEYSIKDTMSIKISFMHYIKWTSKTNITSSFWGIWRGLYFSATFFIFTIIINWWKVNFSKNLGACLGIIYFVIHWIILVSVNSKSIHQSKQKPMIWSDIFCWKFEYLELLC